LIPVLVVWSLALSAGIDIVPVAKADQGKRSTNTDMLPCPFPRAQVLHGYNEDKKVTLKFVFSGWSPSRYLSEAYVRLANCAPQALKPAIFMNVPDQGLQTWAEEMGVLPKEKIRPVLGDFEKAVKKLNENQYFWNKDNSFEPVNLSYSPEIGQ